MRRRRLLVLASYPARAAATRFRACAYFPALAARGIDADLRPFMDDAFMAAFYRPGARVGKAAGLIRSALQRLKLLVDARQYDGVFVQREAAIIGPALFESALARGFGLPLIFDFDDAIWVEHLTSSRHPLAARMLKSPGKTNDLLKMAREVITCTNFLAEYASRYSSRVTVIPTVVSRDAWKPLPGRLDGALATEGDCPVIGWIGTHSSAAHLDLAVPALQALAREGHRFRVRLVGARRTLPLEGVEVENAEWREATEITDFQRIDIGIAPVQDDEWSRGKGGFKQIQYLAVGAPFVSSPVGGAAEFLEHDVNTVLATDTASWLSGLRALLRDQALRARLATSGRKLIEERLCTEAQAGSFADTIDRAMS